MRKIENIGIYFLTGIILFVGGGIFFSNVNDSSFRNKIIEIKKEPEESFRKVGDSQEIIQIEKELLAPPPLELLDREQVGGEIYFSGDYNLLNQKGIIELANLERIKSGLLPLTENKKLNNSAENKVDDIFAQQYFEHTSPEGLDVSDLSKKNGYDYILIGENLAYGDFKNNEDLIQAWMASPGHKANILKTRYTEIGVSAKIGYLNGKQVWVAVQHFGLSSEVCPQINISLQEEVQGSKVSLNKESGDLNKIKTFIESSKNTNNSDYEKIVNDYNKKIITYNQNVASLKTKVDRYNKSVNFLNDCIAGYRPELQNSESF